MLCAPRGFCAGVVRAIDIVERALQVYGPPVYVRHEIVHNKCVVDALRAKGVVFIEELEEAPQGKQPVIFSAHGVAKAVLEEAKARDLFTIDATCPLVTKVHREAQAHFKRGRRIDPHRSWRPPGSDRHDGATPAGRGDAGQLD